MTVPLLSMTPWNSYFLPKLWPYCSALQSRLSITATQSAATSRLLSSSAEHCDSVQLMFLHGWMDIDARKALRQHQRPRYRYGVLGVRQKPSKLRLGARSELYVQSTPAETGDLFQPGNAMGAGVLAHFDADVAAAHFVGDCGRGTGAEEGVENEVPRIGCDMDNPI